MAIRAPDGANNDERRYKTYSGLRHRLGDVLYIDYRVHHLCKLNRTLYGKKTITVKEKFLNILLLT